MVKALNVQNNYSLLVSYDDLFKWVHLKVFHFILFHFSCLWMGIGKQRTHYAKFDQYS
jgi:hypothetical protein